MSATVKFLIGLIAILLMGWIYHGPLGSGKALIGRMEREAQAAVAATELPEIVVRFDRDPLSRAVILSGPANEFQREGMGELKGLNDIVGEIEGVGAVRWADRPETGFVMPLWLESLMMILAAYLIGVGLGWLLFARKREGYL